MSIDEIGSFLNFEKRWVIPVIKELSEVTADMWKLQTFFELRSNPDFNSNIFFSMLGGAIAEFARLESKVNMLFRVARQEIETSCRYGDEVAAGLQKVYLELAEYEYCRASPLLISDAIDECDEQIAAIRERFFRKIEAMETSAGESEKLPLVPISDGELPNELWQQNFDYVPEMWTSLRQVDRRFKSNADWLYGHYWNSLKQTPPQGLVDVVALMMSIEKKFQGKSPLILFKELKKEFVLMGARVPNGRLPITTKEFEELQRQVDPAYRHGLEALWNKITEQFLGLPNLATAEEIKNWLNSPEADILRNVLHLNLISCDIKILPYEIGRFTGLKTLLIDRNELRYLPDTLRLLTDLHTLFLNTNRFEFLPEIIGSLTKLRMFFFFDNMLRFISNEILESPIDCVRNCSVVISYKEELLYQARTPLAQFCQSFIQRKSDDQIKALFNSLSAEDKNLIFKMVWIMAGAPQTEDAQWGEHHVFDDMNRLYCAAREAISHKLDCLSLDQRNRVYGNVYQLAARPVTTDPRWGEHHARDNLPRLADAMAMP